MFGETGNASISCKSYITFMSPTKVMLALQVSLTSKASYISTEEPYISTKESYITFMSPTKVMLALPVQSRTLCKREYILQKKPIILSRTLLGVRFCRWHECDARLLCGNIGLFCGNVRRFCKKPWCEGFVKVFYSDVKVLWRFFTKAPYGVKNLHKTFTSL